LKDLKDIETKFGTIPGKLGVTFMRRAGKKAMKVIRDEAASNAPVDTGLLSESIVIKTKRVSDTSIELSVGPTKDTFYAKFLESGTKKMEARPFLNPALESRSNEASLIFAAELDRLIQDHFKT
jgi:HK97 gp10 family phage protein